MNAYAHIMTNRDKDVFIPLVPSVLGAMLMSKVSRQKEGFREDLIHMVEGDLVNLPKENQHELFKHSVVVANGFMEKWGVNYGHSSIKELDTLQMCIENRSRWFTEVLETVQPYKFMSYIEYSLRYNPPKDYYIPGELQASPELLKRYTDFNNRMFSLYNLLNDMFLELFNERYPELTKSQREIKAFENARNVLPLSTKVNMGMQSNLRAFCNALSELDAYEGVNSEIHLTAKLMKEEAEKVSVGMVRHVEASPYQCSFVRAYYKREKVERPYHIYEVPQVRVHDAIEGDMTLVERTGDLSQMNRFDELPHTFRGVGKRMDVLMSEGAHHQFIRHRAFDLHTKMPDVRYGMLLPEEVVKPGSEKITARIKATLEEAYKESCHLYEALCESDYTALAPYVVLNCNMRRANFFGNLYGMAHFLTLRKEKHAQDEIRTIAAKMHEGMKDVESKFEGLKLDKNEEG
jgi:thymidylate synthase ThyX